MLPPQVIVVGFLALTVGGFALAGGPLSLAQDVGLTEADACASIQANSAWVVPRLEASSFPHVTNEPVERYRLMHAGEVKSIIEVNWQTRNAYCLPNDPTTIVTASFTLNVAAYNALVEELTHVVETGTSSGSLTNQGAIAWGTGISTPDEKHDLSYRKDLALWAAGQLIRGGNAA